MSYGVKQPAPERFWALVEKGALCWEWRGGLQRGGYGAFRPERYRLVGAHRYSWELANSRPVPAGMFVCHRCDNRLCVRPDHLFVGTPQDNSDDASSKGRIHRGDRHHYSKLTADAVREIVRRCAAGETQASVATRFGVQGQAVSKILRGLRWRHVTGLGAA